MKQPIAYLNFDGTTREAMTFYGQCLGLELSIMPFSQMPGGGPPEMKDRVMHSRLNSGETSVLMASDIMPGMALHAGNNCSVMIECQSVQEIERLFAGLSAGGKVDMPLEDTFWGARFGHFTDKFGTRWMLNYDYPRQS